MLKVRTEEGQKVFQVIPFYQLNLKRSLEKIPSKTEVFSDILRGALEKDGFSMPQCTH